MTDKIKSEDFIKAFGSGVKAKNNVPIYEDKICDECKEKCVDYKEALEQGNIPFGCSTLIGETKKMTPEKAVTIIKTEAECVKRQNAPLGEGCRKDDDGVKLCELCDLVLEDAEILEAYDYAIACINFVKHYKEANKTCVSCDNFGENCGKCERGDEE